jgi:hypothetical protein
MPLLWLLIAELARDSGGRTVIVGLRCDRHVQCPELQAMSEATKQEIGTMPEMS